MKKLSAAIIRCFHVFVESKINADLENIKRKFFKFCEASSWGRNRLLFICNGPIRVKNADLTYAL